MANYPVFVALTFGGVNATVTQNLVVGDTIQLTVRNNLPSNKVSVSSGAFNPTSAFNNTGSTNVFANYYMGQFTLQPTTSSSYIINIYGFNGGFRSGRVVGTITQAAASYTLTAPTSIQEGNSGTINISASNHTTGAYYWSASPAADFTTSTGSTIIPSSGSSSFTVTPTAEGVTEGNETATVRLFSDSARTAQVASDTFTITDQAASGGGGGSSGGGATGGSTNQGINVFSPNGTKVFGTDLRTQNIQHSYQESVGAGATSTTKSMANANSGSKALIIILGYYQPGDYTINTSSTGFNITNNTGGTRTIDVLAIRIG